MSSLRGGTAGWLYFDSHRIETNGNLASAAIHKNRIARSFSMRPKPMHATVEDTEINLNDANEVRRWCKELDVSEEALRNAVMKAGTKLQDVEAELSGHDVTPSEDIPSWEEGGGTDTSDHTNIADE